MKRTALARSRKPLPRSSAKYDALEAEFAEASAERCRMAMGCCEANVPGCPPGRHDGHHAHHVRRRKGQPDVHAVEHLRWVCWPGHRWIHANIHAARRRGLLACPRCGPVPCTCTELED